MLTVLFFLVFLLFSGLLSWRLKTPIETMLPGVACGLLLLSFFGAVCGLMGPGLYVLLGLPMVLLSIWALRTGDRRKTVIDTYVLTPGLLLFLLLAGFFFLYSKDLVLSQWDEFSHWGVTIKDMYLRDRLSTDAAACTEFKTYPPMIALWGYLFTRPLPEFQIGVAYFAYNLFLVLLLLPMVQDLPRKRTWVLLPGALILYLLPFLFNELYGGHCWMTLHSDHWLALLFGYVLLSYFGARDKDAVVYWRTALGLGVLCLSKSIGVYLGVMALLVIFLDTYSRSTGQLRRQRLFISAKICSVLLLPLVVLPLIWKLHLHLVGTPDTWDTGSMSLSQLILLLTGRADPWFYSFWGDFKYRLLCIPALSQPGLIGLPYMLYPLLWLGLELARWLLYDRPDGAKKPALGRWLVLTLGYVGYALSLYLCYLFLFAHDEALRFAAMERYLAVYWLGVTVYYFSSLVLTAIRSRSTPRLIGTLSGVLVLLICLVPLHQIDRDLRLGADKGPVYAEEILLDYTHEDELQAALSVYAPEGKTFLLSDDGSGYFKLRYAFLPHVTSGFYENSFTGDTAPLREKLQRGYDYLFTCFIREEAMSDMEGLFREGMENNTLYKVHSGPDGVRLESLCTIE